MRLSVAAAIAAAVAFSACQDPAGVGLGLIDEDQVDPSVRVVPLADLDTLGVSLTAIGIADARNPRPQPRVLVGTVLDPVFGDARSVGYVDALQPTAAQEKKAEDIREVWLELPRTYVYGDTTTSLPVELHQIQGSWEALPSYPSDTLFAVGPVLTSATVTSAPGDTLVRFTLPESWVRANAATLVSTTFSDDFEGFSLQTAAGFAPAPGAVYGFDTFFSTGAGLRVTTAADTLTFALSEVFSSIATERPTAPPATVLPVRRNSDAEVRFTADLNASGPVPLARAFFRLPLDLSFTQVGSFVRPLASSSVLYGVRERDGQDPVRVVLGVLPLPEDGVAQIADTRTLTLELQRSILNPALSGFTRFEILPGLVPDQTQASLSILPIVLTPPGAPRPPRFTLTLIGASS